MTAGAESKAVPQALAARGLLDEARRIYDAAGLVHDGAKPTSIDSVTLLQRALHVAFTALRRLEHQLPADFATSVASAVAFNAREHLVTFDLEKDLKIVEQALATWERPELEVERALVRDYDRVFSRAGELIAAIERHLDALAPRPFSARRRTLLISGLALGALGLGLVIGRCTAPRSAEPADARAAAPVRSAPPAPKPQLPRFSGFQASFFRDTALKDVAFTQPTTRLDHDWGGDEPPNLGQNDHFGVRFDGSVECSAQTTITFYLSSNDGSRLFIDNRQVIDNWGLHVLTTKEGKVTLASGVHAMRVEFFDETGEASVKLEWSSADSIRAVVEAEPAE